MLWTCDCHKFTTPKWWKFWSKPWKKYFVDQTSYYIMYLEAKAHVLENHKKAAQFTKAPAYAGSEKGSHRFGVLYTVLPYFLHKKLLPGLEPVTFQSRNNKLSVAPRLPPYYISNWRWISTFFWRKSGILLLAHNCRD